MAVFDREAMEYDQWYQSTMGKFADEVETKLAFSMLKPKKGMKVLDVGCGTGKNKKLKEPRRRKTSPWLLFYRPNRSNSRCQKVMDSGSSITSFSSSKAPIFGVLNTNCTRDTSVFFSETKERGSKSE